MSRSGLGSTQKNCSICMKTRRKTKRHTYSAITNCTFPCNKRILQPQPFCRPIVNHVKLIAEKTQKLIYSSFLILLPPETMPLVLIFCSSNPLSSIVSRTSEVAPAPAISLLMSSFQLWDSLGPFPGATNYRGHFAIFSGCALPP